MTSQLFSLSPRSIMVSLILMLLVAGCANTPRQRQEMAPRPHLAPGYMAEQRHAISTTRESWMLGNDTADVTLTMPSGEGSFPLVVYLPGMGESAEAGAAWRRPWAEAGYAVLALQPENISRILSSPAARSGEFRELARVAFSPRELDRRQALLQKALAEVKQRTSSGTASGYSRIDPTRVAIAGFDLGAQTAMFTAGEQINGITPFPPTETLKCVLALSPYADFSGAGFAQRFQPIRVPVMSVSSMDDTDAYGLISSAAVRRAPFEYMPPGRKYFLSLFSAPHALLSGKETPTQGGEPNSRDQVFPSMNGAGGDSGGSERRGRGGSRGSRGGGMQGRAASGFSPELAAGAWEDQLRYVQSVTTAYLDALVKNDPVAQEWLAKDARRWLGENANLVTK